MRTRINFRQYEDNIFIAIYIYIYMEMKAERQTLQILFQT